MRRRLARRRYEESGLAAFDIDKENLQRFFRGHRRGNEQSRAEQDREKRPHEEDAIKGPIGKMSGPPPLRL